MLAAIVSPKLGFKKQTPSNIFQYLMVFVSSESYWTKIALRLAGIYPC